jgi:hypothetical protein
MLSRKSVSAASDHYLSAGAPGEGRVFSSGPSGASGPGVNSRQNLAVTEGFEPYLKVLTGRQYHL